MSGKTAARVKVSGLVQGVFFRSSARDVAVSLKLSGWVRNMTDGSVELHAEGDAEKIREMISWCRKGPPSSMVEDVSVEWVDPSGEVGFRITY
jgi:acylphosphatase